VAVRNALQAIGSKILPILSSVIELVGKIIFTFIFVPKFGYLAVILCEPLIWCAMTIELVIALYTRPEMKRKRDV
jgi:O-antigen/teichoic acid export membrane protein